MNLDTSENALIYDWNKCKKFKFRHKRKLELDDETLRDGLQSPSVTDPNIKEKIKLLELMEELKIDTADIGLPGSGPRAQADIEAMADHIGKNRMKITPNCAVRTVRDDITPLIDISQKVGYPIEACTFIGSSPIRQYAEGWTLDKMIKLTVDAVSYATENGLPVMYVTEDTTRADPKTLKVLYTAAINAGAKRICVCDTAGHVTPIGVYYLMKFIKGKKDGKMYSVKEEVTREILLERQAEAEEEKAYAINRSDEKIVETQEDIDNFDKEKAE